ncbi:MAG: PAS domain S-box protein [Planctomycetes bacterium]|nr:PAS domain S-box protein [Planctomycetota bacterium]
MDGNGAPSGESRELGALRAISSALVAVAGEELADEVLFRVGHGWGRAYETEALRGVREDAAAAGEACDVALERRLDRALERLHALGLGRALLGPVHHDPGARTCLVSARLALPADEPLAARPAALGFLTGFVAAATGLDLVCRPSDETKPDASFDIVPAHDYRLDQEPPPAAPAGSARFFLGTLGRSFGDGDLSLADLLENTSDAVILLDNQNVVRYWNRGAEEMFQFTRAEAVGRKAGFILPPDLLAADELGALQKKLASGENVHNLITRRMRKDGVVRWVSLTRTILHDSHGAILGSTAIVRDITEQRETESALERTRMLAMIGELAAKIAHAIKNPLAGIHASVQVLASELAPDDPRREVFAEIGDEIHRLDDTVLDLLHFARPLPPHVQPNDLRTFVQDLVEPLRRRFGGRGVLFEVAIEEGLVVALDARMLAEAFDNLLINAVQALDGPGKVRVEARTLGRIVEVDVSDTGPGIPAADVERIFEPFVTQKSRGTGLGLPIARKNVELHGGSLVALVKPGPGATFRLTLVLARDERAGAGA